MTTKHQTSKIIHSVELNVSLREVPSTIHDRLVAYRATYEEKISTLRGGRTKDTGGGPRILSGLTWKKDIQAILDGKTIDIPKVASLTTRQFGSFIQAVKPAYLDVMRQVGWSIPSGENPYKELDISDPLTAMENEEEVVFIEIYHGNHRLFDIDGRPLPVATYFDYISGYFDESNYDLLKAVSILLERDDVSLLIGGGRDRRGKLHNPSPKKPESYIGNIPGYNAERGRSRCIAFTWHPKIQDYRRVVEAAEAANSLYPNLRTACLNLDIFGLRAGGAAKNKPTEPSFDENVEDFYEE